MATYNACSLCYDHQLSLLIDEAEKIKFDVIGISEAKRESPLIATPTNNMNIYLGARKTGSTSGGVGFLVASHLAPRVKKVDFLNHRIATLELACSSKRSITVIQVYTPTSDSDEEDQDEFYNLHLDTIKATRSFYKIIVGDFNARVAKRRGNEKFTGPH